jgi:phosphopantetheinyl transferase
MPIFFQHQINETTRLGIWKIEESEEFFKANVPQHRDVTHPHKRLQHLAGRFLLQYLFPDFPYELIRIADTRKPFLPEEQYHFSISHCGDYAAAIVSRNRRVGVDIEIPVEKIIRVRDKFLSPEEVGLFGELDIDRLTQAWSAKEAVFKWFGDGGIDFREHIHLSKNAGNPDNISCSFTKEEQVELFVEVRHLKHLVLAWVAPEMQKLM